MYSEKVKHIVIVLLVLLNAVLGFLLWQQSNRFMLTGTQEKSIRNLLSANAISVAMPKLPKNYEPKKALNLSPYLFHLQQEPFRFFDEESFELRTITENNLQKNIWEGGGKTLTHYQQTLLFEYPKGYTTQAYETSAYTKEDAKTLSNLFFEQIKPSDLEFALDNVIVYDDYYVFEYRGVFKEYIVYSNYIRIWVGKMGVYKATTSYDMPQGFTDYARELYAADEALFALLDELKKLYGNIPITISDMEIVYMLEAGGSDVAMLSKAVPCYRVKVTTNEQEKDSSHSYLVNAYTNVVLR